MDLWEEPLGMGQAHHILPYSMGGATSIDNEVVLCPNCHVYYDNLAMCGVMYGGYDIHDMEPSQVRNDHLRNESIHKAKINKNNPSIARVIFTQREIKKKNTVLYKAP